MPLSRKCVAAEDLSSCKGDRCGKRIDGYPCVNFKPWPNDPYNLDCKYCGCSDTFHMTDEQKRNKRIKQDYVNERRKRKLITVVTPSSSQEIKKKKKKKKKEK